MKVFTATSETQGLRDNDFSWTVEGELVFFAPIECGRGYVDDDCGCRRSLAGMVSERATTTVKVLEREDLDPESYFVLVADALERQGYVTEELMTNPNVSDWVHDLTDELIWLAAGWPVGTVLERRGEIVLPRTLSDEKV
jgi:hypothetical protein